MATINVGKLRVNWRGAYNNATAYEVNDAVSSGGNSYICILASTGNAVTNTTYWNVMAEGQNVLTTRGDLLTHNGSNSVRLPIGSSGQVLSSDGTDVTFTAQKGHEGFKFLQTNYADIIADPNASVDYGKNGKYPWLADYTNNWIPTCGFANPACGPVPWAEHGCQYYYRMNIFMNENHEIVVRGDDDFYWFGTSTANKHEGGVIINFNSEFGGMRDGEYPVRFWVMYNNIWLLTSEGNLFGAGDNAYGQLGVGGTTDRYSFTKIAGLGPDATHGGTSCQIAGFNVTNQTENGSTNYGSCFAIDTSGRLFAWGYNGGGKLGIGNATNQSYPVHVTAVSNVKSVTGGMQSAYVYDANGDMFVAGNNQNGVGGGISATTFTDSNQNNVWQMLNNDGYYYGSPTRYAHGHYLNTSGELYGVGGNAVGSVGDGTLVAKGSWTRIGGSATYSSVYYAGNSYYLSVAALGGTPASPNNSLYIWGYNGTGACATGNTTNVQSPTQPVTTTVYTNTTTSTSSNVAPTQTAVSFPVNNITKVWGTRGGQGQSTSDWIVMDNKYRLWQSGHSQSEDYYQTSSGNAAINNFRLDIGPWATTSAITTSHWAGKVEEQVVHVHGMGNSYGSEGNVFLWTSTGREFGKRYNGQGQVDNAQNYIGNWIQVSP